MLTSIFGSTTPQNRKIPIVSSRIGFSRKIISKYVKRGMVLYDSTLEGNRAILSGAIPLSGLSKYSRKNL